MIVQFNSDWDEWCAISINPVLMRTEALDGARGELD